MITVEASIGTMTKVTYDGATSSFEEGDRIAVYAWTGSKTTVPETWVVDGTVNTLGGDGKWTPASPMRWKSGADAHYFLGVSPVHEISSFTEDPYTLNPADYTSSDLLIATNLNGLKAGSGAVALSFEHAMAKLTVNLRFRNEYAATPTVSSVIVTAKTDATVNYLSGSVSATGVASSVSLSATTPVPAGYVLSFSGLQVPQEGVRTIAFTIDGNNYVYEAAEDIPLSSGHNTILGLSFGKDILELADVSVSPWLPDEEVIAGGEAGHDLPLTIEAVDPGAQVNFDICTAVASGPVYYRTWDGSAWSAWSDYDDNDPVVLAHRGDKVQFKGDNVSYGQSFIPGDYSKLSFTGFCYAYGNVMSLITSTGYRTATALTEDYALFGLFDGNWHLLSHPSERLLLPATTLSARCYQWMFYGCSFLTTAPELPATTMKEYCYREMFVSCDLTRGPDLPATALAVDCYEGMFRNCSSLTTAPALPATTLVQGCYGDMFNGCDQLTEAPVLPAETLADYCYLHMFSDCINLNRVVCLATDISATACTDSWLQNVAATGTFITPYETGWTLDSEDGIPFGWTRIDSAPLTFEAIVAGAQVKFGIMDDLPNPVYYRTWDGTVWSSWAEYEDYTPVTLTHIGNKVQFKGDNAAYSTWDELHGVATSSYFNLSGDCYVFGNIMSLINSTDYYSLVTLEADNTFIALFSGCNSYLKINAARPLNLPATTLSKRCYWRMFADCSGMTVAPELPAATLTEDCYGWMFVDCTNLSSVTCLATDITALRCTNMWLWHVSGTGTFTTRTGTGWTTSNLEGIPTGWNRVDLP